MNLRATRTSILILLVALITLSNFKGNAIGQYVLPDPDKTTRYVNNLIDSYNALVDSTDRYRPDFDSIKVYFKLYHDVGYSFEVIVAQAVPDFMNQTDYLDLAFIPIAGNQPNIIMEYNKTGFGLTGEGNIEEDIRIEYASGIIYHDLIFCILKDDISGNYAVNSKNAARLIYDADRSRIPTASQTQIQTTTSQTQTPSTTNSWWSILIEAALLVLTGIIVTVVGDWMNNRIKKKRKQKERKEAEETKRTEKLRRKLLRKNQRVKDENTTDHKNPTKGKELEA